MKARKKPYSPYYAAKPISHDELWKEVTKSVATRFDGFNLDVQPNDLQDDVMDHAAKFYRINDYDTERTLDAVHVFLATHFLSNKKAHGEKLYDLAIGVMAEEQRGKP